MKWMWLLLFFSFCFTAFGQWDQYAAHWEGKAGLATLNMDWKLFAPVPEYPFLLSTNTRMKGCRADGFADDLEAVRLEDISSDIESRLSKKEKIEFVGTLSSDCKYRAYYYLSDSTTAATSMEEVLLEGKLESYSIIRDEDWKGYLEFLYPSPFLYETMSNERVLRELTQEGIILGQNKRLSHYAGFLTAKERNNFRVFVLEQNFRIEEESRDIELEYPYQLKFSRSDKLVLDDISKITLLLSEKAKDLNGSYDGWEIEL